MTETSTFAAMANGFEQREAAAPPVENAPIQDAVVDTSTSNADGAAAAAPQEGAPAAEQDLSSSSFDIPIEDAPNQGGDGAQPAKPSQPSFNWKDELKKVNRDEIVNELGIDPFALELDRHIKGGGQPIDYLNARAIDYNKISDENLIKSEWQKQYPNIDPKHLDLMFNRKYGNLPEEATDEDREFLRVQLQMDGHNIRQAKISDQQKFKVSDAPIPQKDEAYEQWKQTNTAQEQQLNELRNYYLNHEATKALNESKRVTVNLGEGIAPFNLMVNKPELVTRILTDNGEAWRKLTSTPQGEPDIAKQQLLSIVAANPQKVFQDVFNYGVQMGERKKVVEGQNAKKPQAIVTQMDNSGQQVVTTGRKFGELARN